MNDSETWTDLGGVPTTYQPNPKLRRGCGKPVCNHPTAHVCPWLDDTDTHGRAQPCGCTHEAD